MTRQGTGSTTVCSSAGSSRNTSGIRMEAYYFLSHRITAVNTITLVRRDTASHTASHTLSNQHRLLPFSNSCAKDHSISLNFFSLLLSSVVCSILHQHWIMPRSFQVSSSDSITCTQLYFPLQSTCGGFTSCTVQPELGISSPSLAVWNTSCVISPSGGDSTEQQGY